MSSGSFASWRLHAYDVSGDPMDGWVVDNVERTHILIILPKLNPCDHVADQMNIDPKAVHCVPVNERTIEIISLADGKPWYQLKREAP